MKTSITTALFALLAACAWAGPKEDVQAAIGKLADAPSYTWVATSTIEGSQFAPASITGKASKDGYAVVSQERDGNTTLAVIKGDKGVVKTDSGWHTAQELRDAAQGGGGGGRGGGMRAAFLLRTPIPAAEAAKLADKSSSLKATDGAIAGDLTPEGAKDLLSFGRGRPGGQGQGPEVRNAKGSVKYWLKDGALVKMQVQVSGTIAGRNGDRDMARTTTYEFKDVGSTKVEVPEDAKKKLGA